MYLMRSLRGRCTGIPGHRHTKACTTLLHHTRTLPTAHSTRIRDSAAIPTTTTLITREPNASTARVKTVLRVDAFKLTRATCDRAERKPRSSASNDLLRTTMNYALGRFRAGLTGRRAGSGCLPSRATMATMVTAFPESVAWARNTVVSVMNEVSWWTLCRASG